MEVPREGLDSEVELQLRAAGVIRLRIVDEVGAPLPSAEVRVQAAGTLAGETVALADRDGRVELGPYRAEDLSRRDLMVLLQGPPGTSVEVVVAGPGGGSVRHLRLRRQ